MTPAICVDVCCVWGVMTTRNAAVQDNCGNQVDAQESHHEGLRLSVTGALKEDGEPSQLQELLLDAQVTLSLDESCNHALASACVCLMTWCFQRTYEAPPCG